MPGHSTLSILEEKLNAVVEEALSGLQRNGGRLESLSVDVQQKEKALRLAEKQEELDALVLSEMKLRLRRCSEASKAIFLKACGRCR